MTTPPLPELRRASLSRDDVLDLLRDLRMLCTLHEIQQRTATDQQRRLTMEEAIDWARGVSDTALQLRYNYDDRDWVDTLLPDGERFDLTRMAVDPE